MVFMLKKVKVNDMDENKVNENIIDENDDERMFCWR